MTDAHRRHLSVSVRTIGKLLEEAERMLDAGGSETRAIATALDDVRRDLFRFGNHFGLELVERPVEMAHGIRVQLAVASISVAEMRPSSLRGYGEIEPETARDLDAACDELESAIRRAQQIVDGAPA